jgi:predicted GIY-YIG superfamily endonuclease
MPSEARRAKDGLIFSRPASNGTPFGKKTEVYPRLMFYVYLLRSQFDASRTYVGFTEDLRQRLSDHNRGKSVHTAPLRPWRLETYLAFSDREQALDFERYLKTASGIAFARKRLRPPR